MRLLNNKQSIYLCVWNEGSEFEIVEVHTRDSFYNEYKDTNLFSEDTEDGFLFTLDTLSIGKTYTDDNMTITRIY